MSQRCQSLAVLMFGIFLVLTEALFVSMGHYRPIATFSISSDSVCWQQCLIPCRMNMYDAAMPNDVNAEVLLDKTLQELRMLSRSQLIVRYCHQKV